MKHRILRSTMVNAVIACLATATVMVNQTGYLPTANKEFFTTTAADSFHIVSFGTSAIVYRGAISISKTNDGASGTTVYRGDFTEFSREGMYSIITSAHDTSEPFLIDEQVFNPVAAKALKGFYYQRCGMALTSSYAGLYAHPACHMNDGIFHRTTDTTGKKVSIGGWHDAGDYGKYIVNAGISVATLLMAYESFPSKFSSDRTDIPESGNGIPDILDESRYEIRWMMTMQHWNGGVYCKLTREQFSRFMMPQKDTTTRYLYRISSAATGDFAAVCARAARIFAPFDKQFADSCLHAARSAWEYLHAHPRIVPERGFRNPDGTATGEYGDRVDSDERLWAATELYATTGEEEYNTYFLQHTPAPAIVRSMSWSNVQTMANLTYLFSSNSPMSPIMDTLRASLLSYAAALHVKIAQDGFHVAIQPGEYRWGSNSEVLNRAILLIYAFEVDHDPAFLTDARSQLNYILGCNINDICFVTGIGTNHVMHPHHRPSASDGIAEPVPGLMAGGPNQFLQDSVLQSRYTFSTPAARCYIDHRESYASNEIAINWNAPLVFVAGYFADDSAADRTRERQR